MTIIKAENFKIKQEIQPRLYLIHIYKHICLHTGHLHTGLTQTWRNGMFFLFT